MCWPVTNLRVQVSMADTGIDDSNKDFSSLELLWGLHFSNADFASFVVDDGSLVRLWNVELSLSWVSSAGHGRCECG